MTDETPSATMERMRLTLLALATGLAVVGVASPASAAPGDRTVSTPIVADGWYALSSACVDAVGCAPAPALTTYPVGTLHVGTSVTGAEDSRTYLKLDLSRLPAGTTPVGGTLALPIAPAADGTSSPETAAMQVCLVFSEFDPAAEGATQAPPVDCTTTAPAVIDPGATRFTVDLAPLTGKLRTATGIALVPASGAVGGWHIAMSSSARQGATTAGPSAQLTYQAPVTPVVGRGPVASRPVAGAALPAVGPVARVPVAPVVSRPQASPTAAPVAPVVTAPVFAPVESAGRFAYPSVFLVPIALLAGAGWSARAFTRDLLAQAG